MNQSYNQGEDDDAL